MVVTVKAVDAANRRVTVTPAIPGSEPSAGGTSSVYTAFDTRVYANVVAGGHGESQAWKVLGSGDATRSNQSFVLAVDDVSFTVDALFPSGVRAALVVQVDGRTWTQLPSLNESTAEDHHYAVRVREDNTLLVQFGDGRRGRRLSSGNNNVQVSYRRGVGLAGNLDAFALEKAVKPHYLVDAQLQPLPATGGGDRESTASLRENAPESVLTLERAVSLGDFKHLAASNSGVWQAEARFMPAGLARRQNIAVAVVPAGGGPLGNLEETLKSFLETKATPGVAVSIRGYQSLLLDLDLVITVDESAFDPEQIAQHVCDVILDSFSLRQARLGASLYRSQVFAAVEAVVGVENCQCVINPAGFIDEEGNPAMPAQLATSPTGAIKRITTFLDQLVYADADLSTINISTQALE
jgi:predicted phage baseplate assembly protein